MAIASFGIVESIDCMLSRRSIGIRLCVSCAAFALILCARPFEAGADAETAAPQDDAAIGYRRIFVPTDEPDKWPLDGAKYLPVESAEFQELVSSVNRGVNESAPSAAIVRADYTGRMDRDGLVRGRGTWTIVRYSDGTAMLPIGDVSLMINEPNWRDDPARPVRLGLWGTKGASASTRGLAVPRSGILEFAWQADFASTQEPSDAAWSMPPAAASCWVLDLPSTHQSIVRGGVVVESRPLPPEGSETPFTQWTIAFGATSEASLQIIAGAGLAEVRTPDGNLRDELSYRLHDRGVDISATFYVDKRDAPTELVVSLSPGVHPLSAVAEGSEIDWQFSSQSSDDAAAVVIFLPAPDNDRPLKVTLNAWHPLVVSRLWRLPSLRPKGLQWTAGTIELVVEPTLELQRIVPIEIAQTAVQPVAGSAGTETHRFVAYAPNSSLEVAVAPQDADVKASLVSLHSLAEPAINGRVTTQIDVTRGKLDKLTGRLARGWVVEAVDSVPDDVIGDWFVDRTEGVSEIEIQLSAPSRSVTVILTGRLELPTISDPISADALRMVRWRDVEVAEHVLAFPSVEPYAVEPVGELPPAAVSPSLDVNRVPIGSDLADQIAFDLANAPATAGVRLVPKQPEYDGELLLDAVFEGDDARLTYQVTALPNRSRINRLVLLATAPLGDDVQWTDRDTGNRLSAERLAREPPGVSGEAVPGERWAIDLPEPTTRPVKLTAALRRKVTDRQSIPLLALQHATHQVGRVHVALVADCQLELDHANLQPAPIPIPAGEPSHSPTAAAVLGAFRYDPDDFREVARRPQMWARPQVTGDGRTILAQTAELESFFSREGRAAHRLTLQFDRVGSQRLKFQLPPRAEEVSVSVNGRPLESILDRLRTPHVTFSVPEPAASTTLQLDFVTQLGRLVTGKELTPPLPPDVRILSGGWAVWVPPEFEAMPPGFAWDAETLNWRQRLFGMLGRARNRAPFAPHRASSWGFYSPSAVTPDPFRAVAPNDGQLGGWRKYQVRFVAQQPAALVVAYPPVTTTWAVAIFLLGLVLGRRVLMWRKELYVAILAIAAMAALLVPLVYAPLATGAFLGLLVGLFAAWPRSSATDDSPTKTWYRYSAIQSASVGLALILAGSTFAQQGGNLESWTEQERGAEQAAPTDNSLPDVVRRVLIPANDDGSPAGTKYFVEEELLRELYRRARQRSPAQDWLIIDASLDGELLDRADPNRIVANKWTLMLDIEVLTRETTLVLPLGRSSVDGPLAASVDGIATPVHKHSAGCAIDIPEPGRYAVAFTFTPSIDASAERHAIDLQVPATFGGRFRLNYPPGITELEVTGVLSTESADETSNAVAAVFDGSGRLNIRWPRLADMPDESSRLRITDLQWLHIAPDDVQLFTKLVLEGGARRPESLLVETDGSWQLTTPHGVISQEPNESGGQLIRVALPPDDSDRQEVSLQWRPKDAHTLGLVPWPNVRLVSLPSTQRWFGVSCPPALRCEFLGVEQAAEGTPNEFQRRWGDDFPSDGLVGVLTSPDVVHDVVVAVRPRSNDPKVAEVLHVAADTSGLLLQYDAEVATGRAEHFQAEFNVTDEVDIDEVSLTAAGQAIPVRWSRPARNLLHVFFGEGVAESYRIAVRGHVPAERSGSYAVPRIALANNAAALRVHFHRSEEVLLEIRGVSETERAESTSSVPPPATRASRPAAVFDLIPQSFATGELVVSRNLVRTTGHTITSLEYNSGAWWASFTSELEVEGGELGTLQLRAPPKWAGALELQAEPNASVELMPADGQQASVIVRFADAVPQGSRIRMRLRGRLSSQPNDVLAVPRIVLETQFRGRHFIQVPERLDARRIDWTVQGVRSSRLPPGTLDRNATVPGRVLEVVGDPFRVAIQAPEVESAQSSVRLADTLATVDRFGGRLIIARMVVVSQNASRCILQLPADQELLQVTSDGRPALTRQLDRNRWRIPLGAAKLPQLLEIVSRSIEGARRTDHRIELSRPLLLLAGEPIDVEVSLWSVAFPTSLAPSSIVGMTKVPSLDQTALRFDRLVSIVDSAMSSASELPQADGRNWYLPWSVRLQAMRQSVQREVEQSGTGRSALQIAAGPEEQFATASGRLDAWLEKCRETWALRGQAASAFDTPIHSSLWGTENSAASEWVFCVSEGDISRLVVESASTAISIRHARLVGLLGIVASALGTIAMIRWPAGRELVSRFPHALAFLAGLAFWAFLWPSALGLAVSAGSIWLALRSGWPEQSRRAEGSTVLRAEPPPIY